MFDDSFLREIKEAFIVEAMDNVQQTESYFLRLEKDPNDPAILEAIFRLAHNLKGGSKSVGFDGLSEFFHKFENLLCALKKGDLKISSEIIDLLLQINDRINENLEILSQNNDENIDNLDLKEKIIEALNSNQESESEFEPTCNISDTSDVEEIPQTDYENESTFNNQESNNNENLSTHLEKNEETSSEKPFINEDLLKELESEIKEEKNKSLKNNEEKDEEIFNNSNTDTYEDLGTILIKEKIVSPDDVEKAAEMQQRKIGEILVAEGKAKQSDIETALDKQASLKAKTKKPEEYIRINLNKIDNLLDYFGEQLILQSTLEFAKNNVVENEDLILKTITQLNKITYDLQQNAISLRMLSVKNVFGKMERIVRDTSRNLNKKIEFIVSGENHELDKTIVDSIVDPLTHMVRNAVDHGIEATSEERIKAGKPEYGRVWLNAYHKGGFFNIEIKDDGKGLDKNRILEKAIKNGLIKPNHNLKDEEIYNLIFESGFSTKEKATEVSGRGVGMDVVKHSVNKLKGTCSLSSNPGKGSTFLIKLPLTLAIFNGMIIEENSEVFIFPNSDIEEAIVVKKDQIRELNNHEKIFKFNDEVISAVKLSSIMPIGLKNRFKKPQENDNTAKTNYSALITSHKGRRYAILVDELMSQQRIVLKNLGKEIENLPGVAGGTILGNGKVALILETSGLLNSYRKAA
jgi:two-component system, chemotaxis family, sensor kinase CheA